MYVVSLGEYLVVYCARAESDRASEGRADEGESNNRSEHCVTLVRVGLIECRVRSLGFVSMLRFDNHREHLNIPRQVAPHHTFTTSRVISSTPHPPFQASTHALLLHSMNVYDPRGTDPQVEVDPLANHPSGLAWHYSVRD